MIIEPPPDVYTRIELTTQALRRLMTYVVLWSSSTIIACVTLTARQTATQGEVFIIIRPLSYVPRICTAFGARAFSIAAVHNQQFGTGFPQLYSSRTVSLVLTLVW